jgi:hypothetical protein
MLYDYDAYVKTLTGLQIKDYYIVTGIAGSRTDMITAWLATCHPHFHDNIQWGIDTHTGASMILPSSVFDQHSDHHDHGIGTQDRIDRLRHWTSLLPVVDHTGTKSIVGKSHMKPWMIVDAVSEQRFATDFKIIAIDTTAMSDRSLADKITWEFVAKTFMSRFRKGLFEADPRMLKQHTKKVHVDDNYRMFLGKYSLEIQDRIIFLDYEKIITPEGGLYICKKLNIEPDESALESCRILSAD